MNIGFIGAGKVGCSLGKYFSGDSETVIKGYYSLIETEAKEAAIFTESKAFSNEEELIDECDAIFLTVPDGSIHETWEKIKGYKIKDKIICHCSGAMSSEDAFEDIEKTGAFGYSAHPLFAVSDRFNTYRELSGVFFTLEGRGEEGMKWLQSLLSRLGNPNKVIGAEDKIKYHCAAATASNLVCGLIEESLIMMEACGFDREEALFALRPILKGNMEHIINEGPIASLTGPVERNDIETVNKHLNCLEDGSREIYRLLTRKLIDIGRQRHPDIDYAGMLELVRKEKNDEENSN